MKKNSYTRQLIDDEIAIKAALREILAKTDNKPETRLAAAQMLSVIVKAYLLPPIHLRIGLELHF